jgi:hypothetical protein
MEKELNYIPKRGVWSDSTTAIDDNFKVLEDSLTGIEDDAQKCKGLFPSLSSLQTEYPNPSVGSWAYIGSKLPASIYVYKSTGGWTSTGKTGGGDLDPSPIYANSVAITNVENFYKITDNWIYGYNGDNWANVSSNKFKVNVDATSYTLRLSSLSCGESGELLERTTTDAYLYKFKYGSFVSMNLYSSDGVSKDYTANTLSWTIDNTFYKRTVSGRVENRLPVVGDTMRSTLKFKVPGDDSVKVKGLLFKFVS